ncbi:MAG: hypothetical protein E7055_11830 [Lentisphaerae bacterium]|nr:hypothetical protein [Lentisphaerota bacterium]
MSKDHDRRQIHTASGQDAGLCKGRKDYGFRVKSGCRSIKEKASSPAKAAADKCGYDRCKPYNRTCQFSFISSAMFRQRNFTEDWMCRFSTVSSRKKTCLNRFLTVFDLSMNFAIVHLQVAPLSVDPAVCHLVRDGHKDLLAAGTGAVSVGE